jgi:acyl-coenzyme A synthetase/AMP-(fatty) acid ligase
LRPLPEGESGELYIGGTGLSPGYWGDREKTEAAFLTNPDGQRLYRTGDLAKTGPDGLIYLLGRSDSQIKSRGYRIELGEIEASLHALEEISECAVVALESEEFDGTAIGCAYVADAAEAEPIAVKEKLSALLPSYMLPSRWMRMSKLPLNGNGKVDRPRLREQFGTMAEAAVK